jgi:hypothetical protein
VSRKQDKPENIKLIIPQYLKESHDQIFQDLSKFPYSPHRIISPPLYNKDGFDLSYSTITGRLLKIDIYKKDDKGTIIKTDRYLFEKNRNEIKYYNPVALIGKRKKNITPCEYPEELHVELANILALFFVDEKGKKSAILGNIKWHENEILSLLRRYNIEGTITKRNKAEQYVKKYFVKVREKAPQMITQTKLDNLSELLFLCFKNHIKKEKFSQNGTFFSIALIFKAWGLMEEKNPFKIYENVKKEYQRSVKKKIAE